MYGTRGMLICAGTLLTVTLLAEAAPMTGTAPDVTAASSSTDVPKEVVSEKFRMVFLAGLEGAGHHYIMASDSAMFDMNPDLPRISEENHLDPHPYYLPTFMARSILNYDQAEDKARVQMQRVAEEAAGMPLPGSLYVLHNSWSYPTFHGPDKIFQYLDLQRMAEVAEDSGVDMRVLYLRRSAKGLLVANAVHRKFQDTLSGSSPEERFLAYVRILFTNIAVLQSFLSELPPGRIVCHDWDRLGDIDQAAKIAGFISPNEEIARLVQSSLVGTVSNRVHHPTDDNPFPFDGADAFTSRLQKKLDVFETRYCGPKLST